MMEECSMSGLCSPVTQSERLSVVARIFALLALAGVMCVTPSSAQVGSEEDRALLNAQFAAMHTQGVPTHQVRLLADVLAIPTERLGGLQSCEAELARKLSVLESKARDIASGSDLGVLVWNPEKSQVAEQDRAQVWDAGVVAMERVAREAREAQDSYFDCMKALADGADTDRLRAFDLLAAGAVASSVGNPTAQPDLVLVMFAGAHQGRAYSGALPTGVGEAWQLALEAVRADSRARAEGTPPPPLSTAILNYLIWRAELKGELATKFKQPRWEELKAGTGLQARTRKLLQARWDGTTRHAIALGAAIEETLGAQSGGRAARAWRRDVRSSQWPHFFGDSELDQVRALLVRFKLDEATSVVTDAVLDDAGIRLDAADAAVADAAAAVWKKGVTSPPGGPGWEQLSAAAKARIAVLDQMIQEIGSVLTGTNFEDRWRAFVIDLSKKRPVGHEWETS